ncbi:hypothetical protein [Ferruginibacter sp. HRS2-29]|uniref:hypothetical protein n=1 Tax=Ferruginibacter sp. HRS2-29 TaxID=2487334 RepID=UPI0020CC6E03|nr:hypothetical protein [Ferruginibacter sp. HRS2-29]MCP9750928.1 hypothetical protein [Ferruginibacter sp. HRS2-29]
MYKFDKSVSSVKTFREAELDKRFSADTPLGERLRQAWYLTCMAYGIDPLDPPKMDKTAFSMRKHSL